MKASFPPSLLFLSFLLCSCLFGQEILVVFNTDNSGSGSLRQAILNAPDGGTIVFDSSLNGSTITLTDDQLTINKSLIIDASSLSDGVVIDANADANAQRRVLDLQGTEIEVTLIGLNFINGYSPDGIDGAYLHLGGPGGAILNRGGTLVLKDCSFLNNQAGNGTFSTDPNLNSYEASGTGGFGGAIANRGEITATNCILRNNRAGRGNWGSFVGGDSGSGGAIFNGEGAVFTMSNCTLVGNQTSSGSPGEGWHGYGGNGGAIFNGGIFSLKNCSLINNGTGVRAYDPELGRGGSVESGGAIANYNGLNLSLSYCTLVNNWAGSGGAISGGASLSNCTIIGNKVGLEKPCYPREGKGGGISGAFILSHCIISGNTAAEGSDISGIFDEGGPNIISSETPLLLAPLGNYGGPTPTMPPLKGSPAIDAGETSDPGTPDQRGFVGFIDGDGSGTPAIDLGAVEFQGEEAEEDITFDLDSDGDGTSSGVERAIGTNPLIPDAHHENNLRLSGLDPETGKPLITFGYQESGIRLRLLRSTNLVNFESVIADSNITPDFDPQEAGLIEVKDETSPAQKAYYRLQAIRE